MLETDYEQQLDDKLFPAPNTLIDEIILDHKNKATKCKVISLENLGHHPLSNQSNFIKRDKDKVFELMKIWFEKTEKEINDEFNSIVNDKILNEKSNYENYKIFNNQITYPELKK